MSSPQGSHYMTSFLLWSSGVTFYLLFKVFFLLLILSIASFEWATVKDVLYVKFYPFFSFS